MKKLLCFLLIFHISLFTLCSCAPLRRVLDKQSNFSLLLAETEEHIRSEEWGKANESLKKVREAWKKIKPPLQLDIDHDYINDIENNFSLVDGYIQSRNKAEALAYILLIKQIWKNIGEM